MERLDRLPTKTENLSSKIIKVFPLLSPEMESKLLKEPWPQLEQNTQIELTPTFWEENFQDLSDWCVDPQRINPFHIPTLPPSQKHRDYHIGEEIETKNSGAKDNNDNLSYKISELQDITGIIGDNNWTVDQTTLSTEMSSEGSLPVGQDLFNTVTDITDVWFDPLLPTTSETYEQQITNNSNKLITNRKEKVPTDNHSLDLISETIDNWFPINITTDNNINCDDIVTNIQCDDNMTLLNDYQSTSANITDDDKVEKKHLIKDILLPTNIGSDSFDLLSYVCDEGGNFLDKKNNDEIGKSTTAEIVKSSKVKNITKSKSRRDKRISQVKAKVEPYIPPLKINMKSKNLPVERISSFKLTDQESGNYSDSESDTTHTSDYSYRELREKNNMASRKSRINKKVKETEMLKRASDLERDNAVLKMKVEELEKLVSSMRATLLQSALKKEKN